MAVFDTIIDLKEAIKQEIRNLPLRITPIGKPLTVHRIEMSCAIKDILGWIQQQKSETKVYFSTRNNEMEVAGIGVAHKIYGKGRIDYCDLFEQMRVHFNPLHDKVKYYGGHCFDALNSDANWSEFGSYNFIIPRFELTEHNGSTVFACNIVYHEITEEGIECILNELEGIDFSVQDNTLGKIVISDQAESPSKADWDEIFNEALNSIKLNILQKVVLARRTTYKFNAGKKVFLIKKKLKAETPECYHFCLQVEPGLAFLGASPERLIKRSGRHINTEAIAGTRKKGATLLDDERLKNELLSSEKDQNEHQYVVDEITDDLSQLCKNVTIDSQPSLLELKWGRHLKTNISADLSSDTSDEKLLALLHPTPAVAGTPIDKAVELINKIEPFSRGWYAGPFGFIGKNGIEFTVAIRSGLIREDRISLFAGAGILSESCAGDEWEEIENKMDTFISVLSS